tara:strand:+ start:128 stop:1066 length:939 start_codon:yes stop_codon:yes gene_type:complete
MILNYLAKRSLKLTKIDLIQNFKSNKNQNGFKYLIGSGFAFSLMTVCVKAIGEEIPVAELVFARAFISIIITRFMLLKNNINPWGNQKKLLILRGLLGTGALFCIFKALTVLPIATATVIQYTYPTFTVICAYFILKEKVKRSIIISIIIGWLGILFVAKPEWNINENIFNIILSLSIAIIGALLTSLAYIFVRKLSAKEHRLVIIYYFPLVSIPISIPFIINNFVVPSGTEWLLIIGIGLFTQIGQLCITEGLRLIPAGQATSLNYSQVVFASLWGALIFKEPITSSIYLGGLCVLISTVVSMSSTKVSQA